MQTLKNSLIWLWLAVFVLGLDRVTKVIAQSNLIEGYPNPVIPGFFDLTLLYNEGAAFGFLSGAGGWQRWFFSILAIIMSIVLVALLKKTSRNIWWLGMGLSLILSGAIGNLYDRVVLGKVVDYLSFHFGTYSFPAFNVADMAISVGAFLYIIDMLFFEKKRLKLNEESSTQEKG